MGGKLVFALSATATSQVHTTLRTRGIAHHQTTLAWIYDAVRGNCQVKKVSAYCLVFVCSPGLGLNWNDPGSHVVMSLSVEICQIETHP
jgi:hypothetical protein